jgi:hypothetical protein
LIRTAWFAGVVPGEVEQPGADGEGGAVEDDGGAFAGTVVEGRCEHGRGEGQERDVGEQDDIPEHQAPAGGPVIAIAKTPSLKETMRLVPRSRPEEPSSAVLVGSIAGRTCCAPLPTTSFAAAPARRPRRATVLNADRARAGDSGLVT